LSSALKVVMLLIPLQEAFTSNLFEETVKKKKKSVTFTVKYQQLWLPEIYLIKYGSNTLR